ncbi:CDP-alcohol phosphatidyltransferase family protein [Streptomyces sp. LHD-70]|uniref:CDP-alcohol phosphatidyltransferase family protein n=1 Tax=Streptomyces sp. LHD-70 TaxID=3072140 RepID=UPI0028109230|nr:CDP-alcohol phosphatidyltransferase family protein [Streptomyces sp. LHD-70]MDQ8703694.1 CDP-alcohol phosphatidyltransferase family protein [Streptomyces sp. LHD-70]
MRRDIPPLSEVRRITEKKRDAWWTVLLVDPVATPLVRQTAMRTRITPNQITWGAFLLGLVSAACFAMADWRWMIAGAVVYHLSFILDCMDGKVARLTGTGSVFGAWLDFVFDRIRVMVCSIALMAGQYQRTGETIYIWLSLVVIGLDTLRYINSLEIFKIRHSMRKQIKSRMREARRAENQAELAFMEDLLRDNPAADIEQDLQAARGGLAQRTVGVGADGVEGADGVPGAERADVVAGADEVEGASAEPSAASPAAAQAQVIDLHQEFRHRFPWYLRCRSYLLSKRIRTHLVSGIEFQMGVFMIGPLFDVVIPATIISGALLLVFELAIIYKLLLSTRDFTRTIDSFEQRKLAAAA